LPTLTVMAIAAGSLASALAVDCAVFILAKGRRKSGEGK
jgi:hypothetical protein